MKRIRAAEKGGKEEEEEKAGAAVYGQGSPMRRVGRSLLGKVWGTHTESVEISL